MIDKKYYKYYMFGYLNMYFCNVQFAYNSQKETYKSFRIRATFGYLGLRKGKANLEWLAPVFSITEAFFSSILLTIRFLIVSFKSLFIRRKEYNNYWFLAGLNVAGFRVKGLLKCIRPQSVHTLKIPFIKSGYSENEVDILSSLRYEDILNSYVTSIYTVWSMYARYRKRDPIFRSYSSFEYYLVCCFVERNNFNNTFLFYSTHDRWAHLMCNTLSSLFIQHGKLPDYLHIIRIGSPQIAYFLNVNQKDILEKVLFTRPAKESYYRPLLELTDEGFLKRNGKKNVLIVCWNNKIEKEKALCSLLYNDFNLYLKPHPGSKEHPAYQEMTDKYGCIIIPKICYPKVDVVISYDSTLADEYEDVGVKVVRYDILPNLGVIRDMI